MQKKESRDSAGFRALVPLCFLGMALFCAIPAGWAQSAPQSGAVPPESVFEPPAPNACVSLYDQFYAGEPGVYSYWALCEPGAPMQIYDYIGSFDLSAAAKTFGQGSVTGGAPGPVPDNETAGRVSSPDNDVVNQGIPLNTHQGTIALWIKSDSMAHEATAAQFKAVQAKAGVAIAVVPGSGLCLEGNFTNIGNEPFNIQKCGYDTNAWHRAVFTWNEGHSSLWVDGSQAATGSYSGALENKIYYYKLFPGCCDSNRAMSLAKVAIANKAWTPAQIQADYRPTLPQIPAGGLYISSGQLGTIHRDVLGIADFNQDLSSPDSVAAALAGFTAAGFTAVRYAGGYGGIEADVGSWKGEAPCSKDRGRQGVPRNAQTANTLDKFYSTFIAKLKLDTVYTVNYGTNPPACDAGGDPIANGADLVQYANITKHMGIKRWEIGNEVYSKESETDFHSDPNLGKSYVANEPAFYDAMKARDPSIQIAVPIGLAIYPWQVFFDLPVLEGAKYDAVIWHNYPIVVPITDGSTIYPERVTANLHRAHGGILKLQTELLNNGKPADAIWVTEWDGEVSGFHWSKQTIGAAEPIFAAIQLAEYMQAGIPLATWWTQGKANICTTQNYDPHGETAYSWYRCGSASAVYTGQGSGPGEVAVGLKPGDLFPAARAFQLLSSSGFVTEGEHMLQTYQDVAGAPWLLSYAGTHGQDFAAILINRDRDQSHTVPIKVAGKASGSSVEQWSYGRQQYDRTRSGDWSAAPTHTTSGPWSGTYGVTLPPLSVTVVILH